jgi:hypothetical protein
MLMRRSVPATEKLPSANSMSASAASSRCAAMRLPLAMTLAVVLAELGTWYGRYPIRAEKTQWRRWDDYMADLVVVDPFEHAALVHVHVVHDLVDVAHRGAWDAVPLGDYEHFHLAEGQCPRADETVGLVDMRDAVGIGPETRGVAQVFAAHRGQEMMPMLLNCDLDRDIAVIGRVNVERRARMAAVARSRWNAA